MKPQINELDKVNLQEIIDSAKYGASINFGKYKVFFDLASAGQESDAELYVVRQHGYVIEHNRRAAILAASITKISAVNWEEIESDDEKFVEKYNYLRKLQPIALNYFWETYQNFRAKQEEKFKQFLESGIGKKSAPNQN